MGDTFSLRCRLDQLLQNPLDLVDGVVGKGLGHLTDHVVGDFRMQFLAQFAENAGRRDEHDLLEAVLVGVFVKQFGSVLCETLFGQPMPVGLLDGTALAWAVIIHSARSAGALFAGRGIVLLEFANDFKDWGFAVAGIFEKQRLFAVGNQNPDLVVELEIHLLHRVSSRGWLVRSAGTRRAGDAVSRRRQDRRRSLQTGPMA